MHFSIVVPIYNAAPYLQGLIDSVQNQTYGDFELLLIDDGSTDDSGEIIDRAAAGDGERIKAIHQSNAGPIAARRAGILAASGDYVLFADADDALTPNALETLDRAITQSGADVVIYNNVSRFPKGGPDVVTPGVFDNGSEFSGKDKERVYGELIQSWRLNNLWIKAFKAHLVKEDDTDYPRFYDNPNADDLLMSLYPVTHGEKILYLDAPLYIYNRIPGSISSQVLKGQIQRQINEPVMEALRRYMTIWGMDTPDWLRRYYSRRFYGLVSLFFQHYRAAENYAQRRLVMDYPWESHIPQEAQPYLKDNSLDRTKAMQLHAILSRNKPLIDLFEGVGTVKMRLRGER